MFESYGFKRDSLYSDSSSRYVWFRKGDFHVGFDAEDFRDKIYPSFDIIYHGTENFATRTRLMLKGMNMRSDSSSSFSYPKPYERNLQDPDEFITVLDAISEPKRVPLAIGIDWASKLVSIFLQRSAA